jgi:sulfide:quinone oxidoreductase
MTHQPHIVVAGGGVAAVEAVAALRALAGQLPRITLLAPDRELVPRSASVAAPFGFGQPAPLRFEAIARRVRFGRHRATLARVDASARVAFDSYGEPVGYDKLLVAVGARPEPAVPGAIHFMGPGDAPAVAAALDETTRLAFVLPTANGWALPVYELAIMAAVELRSRGLDAEITVVTPEPAPLSVFGPDASAAVAGLLADRGIALRTGARAVAAHDGRLVLDGAPDVVADRVIALPRLAGPSLPGLPHDEHGFIPVDRHGRVSDTPNVFAAGDATTFPLKQGGLATQQADAAAEAIAAELGVALEPSPLEPVLRGQLLTGGAPLYLRAPLTPEGQPQASSGGRPSASVSTRPLWSPPSKIAGRYLAPLLSTARPPVLSSAPMRDQ